MEDECLDVEIFGDKIALSIGRDSMGYIELTPVQARNLSVTLVRCANQILSAQALGVGEQKTGVEWTDLYCGVQHLKGLKKDGAVRQATIIHHFDSVELAIYGPTGFTPIFSATYKTADDAKAAAVAYVRQLHSLEV